MYNCTTILQTFLVYLVKLNCYQFMNTSVFRGILIFGGVSIVYYYIVFKIYCLINTNCLHFVIKSMLLKYIYLEPNKTSTRQDGMRICV